MPSLFLELSKEMILQPLFLVCFWTRLICSFQYTFWTFFGVPSLFGQVNGIQPSLTVQITQNHGYVDWEKDKEIIWQIEFFPGVAFIYFLMTIFFCFIGSQVNLKLAQQVPPSLTFSKGYSLICRNHLGVSEFY